MTILDPNAPIAEGHRNSLRALVRAHPGFHAWREANGFGAHLTKGVIFAAIAHFGLEDAARDILALPPAPVTPRSASASADGDEGSRLASLDASEGEGEGEGETPFQSADSQDEATRAASIEAAIDRVLSPVRPFLAGSLVQTMESALRPLVLDAFKPAVVIEKTPESPLAQGEARRASRIGESTMSKLFGVTGAKGKLHVGLWNDPLARKPDPGYVMDGARMFLGASSFERGEIVWFAGPAGAGKTTLAQEYAARTGRGFVRIGFGHSTEIIDLVGQPEPTPDGDNGAVKMVWRDGVFTQAVRRPGTVILLDELTASPPGTSIYFQTILDERRMTLPTGEVVPFAEGVVVAIADNTAGYGDESGVYAGTSAANGALVDRAGRLVTVDYLPVHLEAQAIENRTGAPASACLRLAEFAAKVRTIQAQSGGDSRPFSIRRLVAFANATHHDLLDADEAWHVTALSRLPEADRESMRQAIRAHFDARLYARELKGEPAQAASSSSPSPSFAPSDEPQQVAARAAFSPV